METQKKILQCCPNSLYSAFDLFPSRKGAAIHINKFARTLFEEMNGGVLHVLGNDKLPRYQIEDNIEIVRFDHLIKNYLRRGLAFSAQLDDLIDECHSTLKICHFRDVWSGTAILREGRKYKTIFEANGFPSVELPFAYQNVSPETIEKLRSLERFCLEKSDQIITPSHSIKRKILTYGIDETKVTVIPNGADLPAKAKRPVDALSRYVIYFGAVQAWQGVDVLLKAFARLRDLDDLHLVICSSNHSRRSKLLRKLAEKLDIDSKVIWHFGLSEEELSPWLQHAEMSVAPLTECSRNIEQGCAPLKILESMAAGVPVIASDLPSVRELMIDKIQGRLVHPDRPGELARIIRVLLQYPEVLKEMGERATKKISLDFFWDKSLETLKQTYRELI